MFKYGGNAMTDPDLQSEIPKNICLLKTKGHSIVIVHGGGPFIKLTLDEAGIESEFIDGQRKTTSGAMKYVEMALKGRVNGSNAGLPYDYHKTDLYLGTETRLIQVLEKGVPGKYDRNYIKKLLRESHINIKLDLNDGKAQAKGWGTDLTTDYVLFNSVYTT